MRGEGEKGRRGGVEERRRGGGEGGGGEEGRMVWREDVLLVHYFSLFTYLHSLFN